MAGTMASSPSAAATAASVEGAPPATAADNQLELGAIAVALVLEIALALVLVRFRIGVGWVLIGHVVVVAGLVQVLRLRLRAGADTTWPMLAVIATLVAGPVGALGAMLLRPFVSRRPADSALLAAWYDRIANSVAVDPANRLADNVVSGRTIGLDAPAPRSFESVIASGSLAERQTALGLIARKFHPAYAPALQAALKSPEPVVRVQAAAVAARVRGELKSRVRDLLASIPEKIAAPDTALAAAADLEGLLRTGLLDAGDRLRAAAALDRLKLAIADGLDGRAVPAGGRTAGMTRIVEAELLKAGRHADLRASRKIGRVLADGRYRVRRVPRSNSRKRAVCIASGSAPAAVAKGAA